MRKGTSPPEPTPIHTLSKQVKDLQLAVEKILNNRGPTVPFYDPDNFPGENVDGQLSLAFPDSSQPKTAWAYDSDNGWWKIGAPLYSYVYSSDSSIDVTFIPISDEEIDFDLKDKNFWRHAVMGTFFTIGPQTVTAGTSQLMPMGGLSGDFSAMDNILDLSDSSNPIFNQDGFYTIDVEVSVSGPSEPGVYATFALHTGTVAPITLLLGDGTPIPLDSAVDWRYRTSYTTNLYTIGGDYCALEIFNGGASDHDFNYSVGITQWIIRPRLT